MRKVCVAGVGQVKVAEHWELSIRDLAAKAILMALDEIGDVAVDALIVGNMLSGSLNAQEHLATLIADHVGLSGVEAVKVEASCASGAAALRHGWSLVAGGVCDVVVVLGVEKMTDARLGNVTAQLGLAADGDYEALHGATFAALNALLTSEYLDRYHDGATDFAPFVLNAHRNAVHNPCAMFQRPVTADEYAKSHFIATPLRLLDCAPVCDGAAAVVLTADRRHIRKQTAWPMVSIAASAAATDTIRIGGKGDLLQLGAAQRSAARAFAASGLQPENIDLFELHDAFPVLAALSLEACGFAEPGKGLSLASDETVALTGRLPIQTAGGLKARGHPVGATGVYQAVECCLQLRGAAGTNQVADAKVALAQNLGGLGATAITHIFVKGD